MHLAFFGVQQNGAAMAACVVNRVVARLHYWRGVYNGTDRRCGDYFEADLTIRHGSAPLYRREHKTLSHRRPRQSLQPVMETNLAWF
jgi:hypothetical protein